MSDVACCPCCGAVAKVARNEHGMPVTFKAIQEEELLAKCNNLKRHCPISLTLRIQMHWYPSKFVQKYIPASEVSRQLPLAFLAPSIVSAILAGKQSPEITAKSLLRMQDLPLAWNQQRDVLGF